MARRLFLHVGMHKTGTTYVQQLMRANRKPLRAHGVLYPGGKGFPSQVFAVWDLLGRRPRGSGPDNRITGAWPALVEGVHAADDRTVLVSDEHLSLASGRQVRTAVSAFPDHEVHVLATVRDLVRVVTSAWQEEVKNRGTWTWAEFAAAIRDPARRGTSPARGFWARQDAPAILATWAEVVPAERVHLVTVPPTGSAPTLLVERLASVLGFDPAALTQPAAWANETVGLVGTELIRQLNPMLAGLNQRQFDRAMKLTMVRVMAERSETVRFTLPQQDFDWAVETGERMTGSLREAGYPVVGDLADLIPQPVPGRQPDDVSDSELLDTALVTLAGLAEQYASAWWAERGPEREVDSHGLARGASRARAVGFKAKRAAASAADRVPLAGRALGAYLGRRRST